MSEHHTSEPGLELTERIRNHLKAVTETSGLPDVPESFERITENWLTKRRLFGEQTAALSMETEQRHRADDPRGVLLITYSGSLLVLGPSDDSGRTFEYASISLRADVPDVVTATGVRLAADAEVDRPVHLADSPVERSSDVLEIASFPAGVSPSDQAERLREAAIFLTNGFVRANQTTLTDGVELEQFTLRAMVNYVAARNGATQTETRAIVDDFLTMVETGMLLGERVSLGSLGKVHLGVRAAQKPRVARHPSTGEELLIPAKPEVAVPKFTFSGRIKERSTRVPVSRAE